MCAFVRNGHEVRVPHALCIPSLRAETFPSPGDKALCATWDEEEGSCGREDDPAGRMVHLGAAVRLEDDLPAACGCRCCFRLR